MIIPTMGIYSSDIDQLRAEIAAAAARMIAEEGADYGTAKRKAAKRILGNVKVRGEFMPNNAQIEDEVRTYQELFFGDTQPVRLLALRKLALQLMKEFAHFSPYLTGAVLNGTAGEHSDIHLQLFIDSAKDVEIFLLNKGIDFDVSETAHANGRNDPMEIISFMWKKEAVHLAVHAVNDLRNAGKSPNGRAERADIDALRGLISGAETK